MIHGSSDAPASVVKDPLDLSKAQKNSVLLGCPSRFTGMFPAKLRGRESVTLGRVSVTSKSVWLLRRVQTEDTKWRNSQACQAGP